MPMIEVVQSSHSALVLRVSGRINALTANEFEAEALGAAGRSHSNVVMDGAEIVYISSAGLRAVLRVSRTLRSVNRDLHICGLRPHIREVFRIIGFDRVIPIHADVSSAQSAAGGA